MTHKISHPVVDIDLEALCRNYRRLAAASPGAEAAAVVKCDAYGLGLAPGARALAQREHCRSFFVAYAQTGASLRQALLTIAPEAAIYIFNGPAPDTLDQYAAHRLTPVLNTFDQARLWARAFPGAVAALHVDTGMNRLGLAPGEIDAVRRIDGLNIALLMSHFACASTPGSPMLAEQAAAFEEIAAFFPNARRSLASTGGALIHHAYGLDMTRLGVGLYGVGPFDGAHPNIEPVATLKAPVIQTRVIAPGESVGYDRTFVATRKTELATVALGYGDGYLRAGSNGARAFIGGAPCPLVGRISMDLIVIDVTDAPETVAVGDLAEFFGRRMLIEDAAAACGTIGYELLTGLGGRVQRRYFLRGEPAGTAVIASLPDDGGAA